MLKGVLGQIAVSLPILIGGRGAMSTINEHVAKFPAESVTVYVSICVPTGKGILLPIPLVNEVIAPGQLSIPTGTG
jgi:hypothetical protein